MATEVQEAVVDAPAAPDAAEPDSGTLIASPGHLISRAWVCPLVKTLCTEVSQAPSPEACRNCAVYKTWHLADNIDPRFWY